jgi:hypothetical protein
VARLGRSDQVAAFPTPCITPLGARALLFALLLALLLPIWAGPYPPLYDYPAHLQAAQVTARYHDPALGYAESYVLSPGWQLRSNALFTLALVALAPALPLALAGKLLLSLTLVLFLTGFHTLLRRSGTVWPLLLLAPPLAYNFTLSSGWVNFALATALGLHLLAAYRRYRVSGARRELPLIALLLLPIYSAHLVVLALLLLIVPALEAADPPLGRRASLAPLLLALCTPLPLIALSQPLLALGCALLAPCSWLAVSLVRRLGLRPPALALISGALAVFALALSPVLERLLRLADPEASYSLFFKLTFPLRTLALPHQFMPPDPLLIAYNLALGLLLLPIVVLLAWGAWRTPAVDRRWLAPLALLALVYSALPTASADIYFTEPRVMLLALLLALSFVRLPSRSERAWPARALQGCAIALCLLSLLAINYYALAYNRRAVAWVQAMETLRPARRVLVLRQQAPPGYRQYPIIRLFNHFYDGYYFSNTYALAYGGSVSANFGNGPIWFRADIPTRLYDQRIADDNVYRSQCNATRAHYDAVLGWGPLEPELVQQLDACLGDGDPHGELTVWAP